MQLDKLTIKGQEALSQAQSLAAGRGHAVIEPVHLLRALLAQPEGATVPVLQKLGVSADALGAQLDQALAALPKVSGASAQPRISESLSQGARSGLPGRRPAPGRVRLDGAPAARPRRERPRRRGPRAARRRRHARRDPQGAAIGARQPARHRPGPRVEVPVAREVRPRPHRARAQGQARSGRRPRRGDPPRRCRCCRGAPRTTPC